MKYISVSNRAHGANDIYVGRSKPRPSVLGNPFIMYDESMRDDVCVRFAEWFADVLQVEDSPQSIEMIRLVDMAIKGPVALICHCAPKACHGNVIARTLHYMVLERGYVWKSGAYKRV